MVLLVFTYSVEADLSYSCFYSPSTGLINGEFEMGEIVGIQDDHELYHIISEEKQICLEWRCLNF